MSRFIAISFALLVLASAAVCEEEEPFNVDFFCGWAGHYRPMEWTPVEVGIAGTLKEPFAGSVTIAAQQDGLNSLSIVHTFVLTPDMPLHLPLVTKLAFNADKCSVNIRDERGRVQWRQDFNLWDFSSRNRLLTPVQENDLLIGLVGRSKFGLLRLPSQSVCRSATAQGKVYVGDKLPRMVPWDWTGFVPLDLLVLYDPDWAQFNRQQLNAIAQWVSNGGKLLLVMGSNPLSADNPIAQLLPFELQSVKQVTLPRGILEKWDLQPDEPETVAAWPLTPKSAARFCEVESNDASECLFATGYAGFGRVAVLAFDPSTMTNKQMTNSGQFWISRIRAILGQASPLPPTARQSPPRRNQMSRTIEFSRDPESIVNDNSRRGQRYEVGSAQSANNTVMEFLYQGIKPLSIWWVIFLLVTLAILLGPLDYKLLKRKDRLPLTWLTCTFWIALFTVGAYYGVQAIRGGDLELRVVSVIDGIEDSDHVWSTDYCGLFAPKSDDYRLKGLLSNQWWSGIAPTQESIWANNRETAGRNIYCYQHDGGNLPYSLPVNIWSVQCLLNESRLERLPFSAEVQRQAGQVTVNVTNESESAILKGYVLFGNNQGVSFGPVQGRAAEQFNREVTTIYSDVRNKEAFLAQGCLQRTRAIDAYLARGAALVCAEYEQAPVSFEIEGRSFKSNHIQLARLVVFPGEPKEETPE
ncbi:MAG: hypothetical protein ABIF19_11015 [Planctomycetota bacterium]